MILLIFTFRLFSKVNCDIILKWLYLSIEFIYVQKCTCTCTCTRVYISLFIFHYHLSIDLIKCIHVFNLLVYLFYLFIYNYIHVFIYLFCIYLFIYLFIHLFLITLFIKIHFTIKSMYSLNKFEIKDVHVCTHLFFFWSSSLLHPKYVCILFFFWKSYFTIMYTVLEEMKIWTIGHELMSLIHLFLYFFLVLSAVIFSVSHRVTQIPMGDIVSWQFRGNHPFLKISVITPGKQPCPMVIANIFQKWALLPRDKMSPVGICVTRWDTENITTDSIVFMYRI